MKGLRDLSIRHKLMAIVMLTAGAGLLLVCTAFVINDVITIRNATTHELVAIAKIIGENSAAPLTFGDSEGANQVLRALEAEPQILRACVYNSQGRPFATYFRDHPTSICPAMRGESSFFTQGGLARFQPIVFKKNVIGTAYVESDLAGLRFRLRRDLAIVVGAMLGSLLAAFLLGNRLQRVVSGPVLALAHTADLVSKNRNYSIRAPGAGQDEIGFLIERFNDMLAEIESRERQLQHHRQDLEKEVAERTAELKSSNAHLLAAKELAAGAQEGLRSALQWRNAIFDGSRDGIFISGPGGMIVEVSPAACELTGYSREELLRMQFAAFCRQGEAPVTPHNGGSRKGHALREVEILKQDGTRVAVEFSWRGVVMDGNAYVHSTARDITERRRSQEAILQSEENVRSLVENAPHGIYRSSFEGAFMDVNPALVRMLGYESKAELLEAGIEYLYLDPEQRKTLRALLLENGAFEGTEARWRRKDGTSMTARLSGRLLARSGSHPGHFEIAAEDITQERRLEEQLRQAHKLEAVGRMAGGIAHDFNNIVMIIGAYSDMILEVLPLSSPLRVQVEQISKAGDRAASLIRQLLAFSRNQVLSPQNLNLHTILTDMNHMLRRLIGENIELRMQISPDLWPVHADAGQVEQVLLNLAANARDAMPRGGRLVIAASNMELDQEFVRGHLGSRVGQHAVITVTDSGCGMTPEVQSHIFDPFFTTKEKGKGTGLGLASVYGTVKQSGGYISVESEPGRTSFAIYIPRSQHAASADRPAAAPEQLATSTATVLVVEDEDAAREVLCSYLQQRGYETLSGRDAAEGLRICQAQARPLDLIVTDVIMPGGMSGTEMAAQVRNLFPSTKVLFVSGYTDDALIHHGVFDDGVAFLQKPFRLSELLKRMKALLDGPQDRPRT